VTAGDLGGVGVLVTRPAEQAQGLADEIRQRGGVPTIFPGLKVEPVLPGGAHPLPARLSDIDLMIFVSPTSVQLGVPALVKRYGPLAQTRVAAVGQSTAAELYRHGFEEVIAPTGASGALALAGNDQLANVSGWTVLIVRGAGGSDLLEDALRSRGAAVSLFECYRRGPPDAAFSTIEPLLRNGQIGAWMATSGQILDNLFNLAAEHGELLRRTPLFVNHSHVAARAFSRKVKVIFVTGGGDQGIVSGLLTWFCGLRNSMS
jgi:uroporphyrinogen-III synthase